MNDNIKVLYGNILKATKEIKHTLMVNLADSIPFLVEFPADISAELNTLAVIDGIVIKALSDKGIPLQEVSDKKGYYSIEIDGEKYITHVSKMNFSKQEIPDILPQKETTPSILSQKQEEKPVIKEEIKDIPIEKSKEEVAVPYSKPDEKSYEETYEKTPVINESIQEPVIAITEEREEREEREEKTEDVSVKNAQIPNIPVENTQENTTKEQPIIPFEESKATVIGDTGNTEPVVAPMSRADVFVEEKRKHASEIVCDMFRLSVCHIGSKAEDMQFMIAPLKIQRYACPTVPVLVAVYYQGKMYTASSFDKNEDGKNIVNIDVGDYSFLCRGYFDDKGTFQSTIQTTGISAAQGDIVNPISKQHYHPTGKQVNNGHVKFKYMDTDGPGIIEVFPFDMEENEFVVMTRCSDFVEYHPVTNKSYGLRRIILYDNDVKSELICQWNDGWLEAEIVPL